MDCLEPGKTCWRIVTATRAAFLIDDQTYYNALADALEGAKRQVLLLGWSFDPRTRLMPDGLPAPEAPDAVGRVLIRLAKTRPDLDIKVLVWRSALAVSATQGFFPHRAKGWFKGTGVDFRLDDSVPFGACHHQKVIVVDDALAFCSSGDLCADRWDTVAHNDGDMRRRGRGAHCHPPRHEVSVVVEGEAAAALGELARERWVQSGGEALPSPPPTPSAWPDYLAADLAEVRVGIVRTQPAWHGRAQISEAGDLTIAAIGAAKHSIYLENQYFASPLAAEALAARLADPKGPEVVLVSTAHSASYFDQLTMDRTRQELLWRLRCADVFGRFRAFSPTTSGGNAFIVHAKVMVIDDVLARIGSANLNNRSFGFDTECDLALAADDEAQRRAVRAFRDSLAGHWFGRTGPAMAQAVERRGGLIAAMDDLNHASGRLTPLEPRPLGPFGKFIAAFHIGDPASAADSWRPLRRRQTLYARARALKGPSGDLEIHYQGKVVGGDAGEAVVGRPDRQDTDVAADEQVVDAQDRHG